MTKRLRKNIISSIPTIVCIVMIVIMIFPILWMLILSVTPRQYQFEYFIPPIITFKNYLNVFTDNEILLSYRNSWIIASGVAILTLVLGLPIAYGISRYRFKLRPYIIGLVIITQMLPVTLLAVVYLRIGSQLGLYNSLIYLVMVDGVDALPFGILLLITTFDSIPHDLEEMAMIDGCSELGALVRITLPVMRPGIYAAGFFAFVTAWIEFLYGLTLTSNTIARPLTVEISAKLGHYVIDWGGMMAMCFILSIPVFVVFLIFQNMLLKGFMTAGALKE